MFVAIAVLLIFQFVYLLISEKINKNISFDDVKTTGMIGDHAQGNYVLYQKQNTILNAPLVFGARLYLYDIEKDKSYLIKNLKLPLQEWGTKMCFLDDKILANCGVGWGDPPSDVILLSIDGESEELPIDKPMYGMTLTKDDLYYVLSVSNETNKWYDTVRRMNLETGEKEDLLQREEYSFKSFYIYDKELFVVDEVKGKLVVKDLSTQKEIEYDFYDAHMPLEIFKKTEESILYIGVNEKGAYKLVEYNLEREKGKVIATLSE